MDKKLFGESKIDEEHLNAQHDLNSQYRKLLDSVETEQERFKRSAAERLKKILRDKSSVDRQQQEPSITERLEKLSRDPDNYIVKKCFDMFQYSDIELDECLITLVEVLLNTNKSLKEQLIEARMRQPFQYVLPKDTKVI
jgi:hypothetical protein